MESSEGLIREEYRKVVTGEVDNFARPVTPPRRSLRNTLRSEISQQTSKIYAPSPITSVSSKAGNRAGKTESPKKASNKRRRSSTNFSSAKKKKNDSLESVDPRLRLDLDKVKPDDDGFYRCRLHFEKKFKNLAALKGHATVYGCNAFQEICLAQSADVTKEARTLASDFVAMNAEWFKAFDFTVESLKKRTGSVSSRHSSTQPPKTDPVFENATVQKDSRRKSERVSEKKNAPRKKDTGNMETEKPRKADSLPRKRLSRTTTRKSVQFSTPLHVSVYVEPDSGNSSSSGFHSGFDETPSPDSTSYRDVHREIFGCDPDELFSSSDDSASEVSEDEMLKTIFSDDFSF